MIGHARWLLWEGYSQGFVQHPELYSLPHKVLMYLLSAFVFGHEAVILFFVLSGFVIHLRYADQLKQHGAQATFDWLPFVGRRARRLYPPFLFAMLLTLLLDTLGRTLGYPIYNQQTIYPLINSNITSIFDVPTGLATLAFVGKIYAQDWGWNGPFWSLTYEWWFYMTYPLCWWLSKRSIGLATGVIAVAYALSYVIAYPPLLGIVQLTSSALLIWWFGALLADVYTGRINLRFAWIAPLILFVPLALVSGRFLPDTSARPQIQDLLWGFGFTGVLALCCAWQVHGRSLRWLEWLKPLGDFSYTLYVTHFPILVFLSGFLMAQSPRLPRDFGWVAVGIGVCLAFAYVAYRLIEQPALQRRETNVSATPVGS